MKHYLTRNHQDADGVWCLCADGQIITRFEGTMLASAVSEDDSPIPPQAVRALMNADEQWSLTAAATPEDDGQLIGWVSDPAIAFVGVETSDRRIIDGNVTWRAFPLPFLAQFETNWGHDGAYIVGRIDEGSVDGENIVASGVIDTSFDEGEQAARMVEQQLLDRVSIDPSGATVETEITEQDEDGWPTDWLDHYTSIEIAATTLVTVSAFADARIKLVTALPAEDAEAPEEEAIAASAAITPPVEPPREWFEYPDLDGLTRLTITDEGRIFGHLAPWGECHIGLLDKCVMAPQSPSNYGWFQLGSVKCEEGCVIPIGTLVMGAGHAPKHLPARAAAAWYDNTSLAVADITLGEDEHGIWYSGALRPTVTPEQVREIRAARPSGDWRSINNALDLVAAVLVNTGGFPVYEESIAADGHIETLIASLVPADDEPVVAAVDHTLRAALQPLLNEAVERLHERVHSNV